MAIKTVMRGPRRLNCPIEPETLLAEIQGELTLDEQRMVQAHQETCAICRARGEQLREAYERVASLADVPEVPSAGLRETILRESHGRLRTVRLARGLNLSSRGLLIVATGAVLAALLLTIAIARPFLQNGVLSARRSVNTLTNLAPVGKGTLYAQTIKLVPIRVGTVEWDLGEIIAIDEQSGQVKRSLPASRLSPFVPQLGGASGANIPPALSPDGKTLVQAAILADGHSPTAFAAIDTATGAVRYVVRLGLPAGAPPQADPVLRQIWIGHDNATVYVLTDIVMNNQRDAHVLMFDLAQGQQRQAVIPPLDAMTQAVGLGGYVTTIAPDASRFFDARLAIDTNKHNGVLISFVRLADQQVESPLFIPGDFQGIALGVSPDSKTLYLFNGNTTTLYQIAIATRSIVGSLMLIPNAQPQLTTNALNNTISVSLVMAPNGQSLYIARDLVNGAKRDDDLWAVSLAPLHFQAVTRLDLPVGTLLLTSDGSHLVLLRGGGNLQTLDVRTASVPQPWVKLDGNTTILQLIGALPPA